uniref:Uncharacterized protein n=1 Tax=Meloidogyne enterolobii TaxID=390850 RepID=A0A6V7W0A7_MELEN|nr:unnamed protein product [Meloidogyne enterolobii]
MLFTIYFASLIQFFIYIFKKYFGKNLLIIFIRFLNNLSKYLLSGSESKNLPTLK